jgi:hypothetical protein
MTLTHLLTLLLMLAADPAPGTPASAEEVGFADSLPYSNGHMLILAVGTQPTDVPCSEGRLLDWAAYNYQSPLETYRFTPADRWRCVKRIDSDTHRNTPHYSPKANAPAPRLPASATTGFYSNLDAATYERFKQRLKGAGSQGFAWKVNDNLVLTYSWSANRTSEYNRDFPDDDRPTWSVLLNEYGFKEKNRPTFFQKNDHALFAEPKVRLFHHGPRHDLFIVSSNNYTGANKYFLWYIDKEKGTARLEERTDKLTLDKFDRCEYILDKGLLWELCEKRLVRGQRNRIFNYWVFNGNSFNLWREGTPGPQPPPTTFPPARTE